MNNLIPNNQELLSTFADKLIFDKHLTTTDPDILAEIKADLLERLDIHINAGILAHIPEHELDRFDKLLDGNNEEQLQQFVKQQIPDLEQTLASILLDFKAAYLGA